MTIAQSVRNHLRNKPYLLEALEKGIVNLSELSRQIQKELKTSNTPAVKAALRRYAMDLQKHKQKREERVLQVLKRSGITVFDKKAVIITSKELETSSGMKVDLLGKHVYLLDKGELPERVSTLVKHDNCTMIVVHSPEELEANSWSCRFSDNITSGAECQYDRVYLVLDRDHHSCGEEGQPQNL